MTEIAFDNSYARLPEEFFARVTPARVPGPELIALNRRLASELGLDSEWLSSDEGLSMLSGNHLPEAAEPIAMAYAGHQFGGFSPQLGDGRALLIGEVVAPDGVRRDLQLKGSGRTPFSRQGDGKSPIGPVVREFIVSEAMAALGIPTTRALAAVATGEVVHREEPLPGGVLTRVAQSHVRVGTFEFFASRGQVDSLKRLADYVIERHYPDARDAANPYRSLLEGVVERQALLVARWMQVGFVHGVMNTDNMQIAGETIDFGPCAFMETFDAATVFSSIDRHGRYAWGNQPGIAQWNLSRLAEALLPLLAEDEAAAVEEAEAAVGRFAAVFNEVFMQGFLQKLGLPTHPSSGQDHDGEQGFIHETFSALGTQRVDFTLFFRHLTRLAAGASSDSLISLFDDPAAGERWLEGWREIAGVPVNAEAESSRVDAMRRVNPIFIPRNHRVEEAIEAANRGDYSFFERLNVILAQPFDEQPEHADFERPAKPDELVERTFCGT